MSENFVINIKHKALILKSFMYTWSKNLFLSYVCMHLILLAFALIVSFVQYSIDPFMAIWNMSIFGSDTEANRICRALFVFCLLCGFMCSFDHDEKRRQPYFCD